MLPKNVRQIGQVEGNRRIYIEDYVMTFARRLDGMAVLMGKEEQEGDNQILYISGAVGVKNTAYGYPSVLTNEDWSYIYEDVKKYFFDYEIVGWMLARRNVVMEIDEEIRMLHEQNFRGQHKILFLFDKGEGEEAVYLSDSQGNLKKQRGYYIYYERNESMQNYMVDKNTGEKVEENVPDKAMEKVREIVAAKEAPGTEKKMINLMYGASTLLAAVILVIGATTLDNYDKMKNMEQTLNVISDNLGDGSSEISGENAQVVEVEKVMGNTALEDDTDSDKDSDGKVLTEEENTSGEDETDGAKTSGSDLEAQNSNNDGQDGKDTDKDITGENNSDGSNSSKTDSDGGNSSKSNPDEKNSNSKSAEVNSETEGSKSTGNKTQNSDTDKSNSKKTDDTQNTSNASEVAETVKNTYKVKSGDTLASISMMFYKSVNNIEKIKELNGIEDGDVIFADQILLLP